MKQLTVAEFNDIYIPQAGFVLIDKGCGAQEKAGSIILTRETRERIVKWSGTGTILSISPFRGETEHDRYLQTIYKEGDEVSFNTTSPIDVPLPKNTKFKKEVDAPDISLVLIHIADLLGFFATDVEQAAKIKARANQELVINIPEGACKHLGAGRTPDHDKTGDWFCPECYATFGGFSDKKAESLPKKYCKTPTEAWK